MVPTTFKRFEAHIHTLGERQIASFLSSNAVDRENDRIDQRGWVLDAYLKNPVTLWAHDYSVPPIARTIWIGVKDGQLQSIDECPPPGIHPLADTVHGLIQSGMPLGQSVGFRPIKWQANELGGRDYSRVELLEHSICPVPANPECLVAAKNFHPRQVDRPRLAAFLADGGARMRARRDDDIDLPVTRAEVAAALRDPLLIGMLRGDAENAFDRAVTRAWWRLIPDSAELPIDLDDERGEDEYDVSPAEIRAAIREVLPQLLRPFDRALAAARGRID